MIGGKEAGRLGRGGEALVAKDLRKRGWRLVTSGFRCRMGEIDLIAQNEEFLIFVEVKLRKNDQFGQAAAFVDYHKQRKLRAAAEYYLLKNPTELQPRFDVAEVYAPQGSDTKSPVIRYIENAF